MIAYDRTWIEEAHYVSLCQDDIIRAWQAHAWNLIFVLSCLTVKHKEHMPLYDVFFNF